MHVLKRQSDETSKEDSNSEELLQYNPANLETFGKFYSAILLSPGEVVSLTILNQKGMFRKSVAGYTGKDLMNKVTAPKNSTIAYFITVHFSSKYLSMHMHVQKTTSNYRLIK